MSELNWGWFPYLLPGLIHGVHGGRGVPVYTTGVCLILTGELYYFRKALSIESLLKGSIVSLFFYDRVSFDV